MWGSGLRRLRRSWQPGRQVRGRSRRSGTLRLFGVPLQSGRVCSSKSHLNPGTFRARLEKKCLYLTTYQILAGFALSCPTCSRAMTLTVPSVSLKKPHRKNGCFGFLILKTCFFASFLKRQANEKRRFRGKMNVNESFSSSLPLFLCVVLTS